MIAYFVRLVVGGMLKLLLAWLLIYTLITYLAALPVPGSPCCSRFWLGQMAELEMDKPWPLSYLAWLYDPADRGQVQVLPYGRATTTPPLAASVGILADDPGVSWQYAPGVPIRALFGATLRELLAVFTPLLLLLMLIAAWQRRGRPQLQDGIRPPAQQDVADRYRGLRPARYY